VCTYAWVCDMPLQQMMYRHVSGWACTSSGSCLECVCSTCCGLIWPARHKLRAHLELMQRALSGVMSACFDACAWGVDASSEMLLRCSQ
jgi:hypothetical protein